MQDINLLKQALPYFRRFKGSLFVVKFGGEPLQSAELLDALAEDISFLHSIGIRVVVVHGGGPQITELEKKLGAESRFVGGRRVTDADSLEALKMALAGKINADLTASLKRYGVRAVGLSAISGDIFTTVRRPPKQVSGSEEVVDFGFVGDIASVNTDPIVTLLDNGYLPVICPLSADVHGQILNVNADVAATRLAWELKAEKLLLLTGTLGVMKDIDDPTTLISKMDAAQAHEAIRQGIISGGMIPKVEESLLAIENGVKQVHILSAVEPHMLLVEIFTETGCGTMLVP